MKFIIPPLIAIQSVTAFAEMSVEDLRNKIEASYQPEITVSLTKKSVSLYGCGFEKLKIKGRDPVRGDESVVNVSVYKPRQNDNKKAVIILPPTGGENILDRGYANEICSSGMTAVIVSSWSHQEETSIDFEMHNNGALRALSATRHVVEYLDSLQYQSIGLLGTSIGAVAGTLVLGFEPRITSYVLIVGSARFADIIANSDESGAAQLRELRMKKYGYKNIQEYTAAVKQNVWIEPEKFITPNESLKTMVISADKDSTVLSEYQLELVELLQTKNHLSLKGDHLQVIKESFFSKRDEIVSHFNHTLGGKNVSN